MSSSPKTVLPKTVFFHAGTYKTGSTFIQKFFYDNREALQSLNVDYILFSAPKRKRYANADLLKGEFDPERVAETVAASPCDNIVISEEALMKRREIVKSPAFQAFAKVVILYVRPPVDLVASWAAENSLPYNFRIDVSRDRGIVPLAEGLTTFTRRYRMMLEKFLDAFAADPDVKLVVRDYDFGVFAGGNIIEDILAVILDGRRSAEAKALYDRYENKIANEGKDRKYCDLSTRCLDIVKSYGAVSLYRKKFVDHIYANCSSGDTRKVVDSLSDAEIRTIYDALAPVYQRLHRLGYKRGAANLERELLPRIYGQPRAPYAPLDDAELRALVKAYVARAR